MEDIVSKIISNCRIAFVPKIFFENILETDPISSCQKETVLNGRFRSQNRIQDLERSDVLFNEQGEDGIHSRRFAAHDSQMKCIANWRKFGPQPLRESFPPVDLFQHSRPF